MGKATNSIARKGSRGGLRPVSFPLAGSRDSVPCGVWGNAPTVPRATSMPNALNKGRRQRSVPASNFARPQTRPPSCSFDYLHIVAPDGRERVAGLPDIAALSRKQGISPLRRRQGAKETDEVCARPLDPFGAATFGVVCYSICSQQEIPLPECFLPNKSPGSR